MPAGHVYGLAARPVVKAARAGVFSSPTCKGQFLGIGIRQKAKVYSAEVRLKTFQNLRLLVFVLFLCDKALVIQVFQLCQPLFDVPFFRGSFLDLDGLPSQ